MICKHVFLVAMAAKKKTPAKKTSTSKSAEFERRSEAVKKVKTLKKIAYPTITNKGAKRKTTTRKR